MTDTITEKIGTGFDNIRIIKNFVDPDDLAALQESAVKNSSGNNDKKYTLPQDSSILSIQKKYSDKIIENLEEHYNGISKIRPRPHFTASIAAYSEGFELLPHVDIVGYVQELGVRVDNAQDKWTGHISGMIYLNDDFEGGELYFPDWGISLKPKAGMFVSFPGSKYYVHGVKPVTAGKRFVLSTWTRFEEAYGKEIYSFGEED